MFLNDHKTKNKTTRCDACCCYYRCKYGISTASRRCFKLNFMYFSSCRTQLCVLDSYLKSKIRIIRDHQSLWFLVLLHTYTVLSNGNILCKKINQYIFGSANLFVEIFMDIFKSLQNS